MNPMTLLLILSMLGALICTPPVRSMALRRGWVDRPDLKRRLHKKPRPRVGGLAVFLACLGALVLGSLWTDDRTTAEFRLVIGQFGLATLLMFVVGLVDDIRHLSPRYKLAGQSLAIMALCWCGPRLESIAGVSLTPWQGYGLTFVWLIFCTNAFNLIDGIDGLASGVGAIAAGGAAVAGVLFNDAGMAVLGTILCGSLLGFLRYNFNPASVFLGDCGSLFVGFLLGCLAILWIGHVDSALGVTAPLMLLALPIADAGISIVRRLVRRHPILSADRNHIHHRLLARGWTVRRTALTLYAAAAFGAALSLLQTGPTALAPAWVIGGFGAAAWVGIRFLGYDELRLASQLIFGDEESVPTLAQDVAGASSVEHCWDAVAFFCKKYGIECAELRLDDHRFAARFASESDALERAVPTSRPEGLTAMADALGNSQRPAPSEALSSPPGQ